jgi:pimeloyl-ACP methyl ester carboxylesterase
VVCVRSLVLADTLGGLWTDEARTAFDAFVAEAAARFGQPVELGRHFAVDGRLDPIKAFLYQEIGSFADPPLGSLDLRSTETDPAAMGVPLLFIVGSDDHIFPPTVIRASAALVPGAKVVEIPGAGHSPYFETPAAWNEAVLAFLGD